jgi:hypothetical protein
MRPLNRGHFRKFNTSRKEIPHLAAGRYRSQSTRRLVALGLKAKAK